MQKKRRAHDNPTATVAINVRTIPRRLRAKFRAVCAEADKPMEWAIVDYIQRCVEAGKLI